MDDKSCLEMFKSYLENEKNASSNTLESYLRDIRQLSEYLAANTEHSLIDASEADLSGYISMLRNSGKSVATVSRCIASIKGLYMQLILKQYIKDNPSRNLTPDKAEQHIPEILTTDEIDLLLAQPKCVDAKGYRDKAMLEVLYATGIRVSELLDINIDDVNLPAEIIRVKSKGKERFVPMYPEAVQSLKNYMTLVRPQMIMMPNEKALFVNVSGERMSRQGFWKIIKQYTKSAGIQKDITPHTLRHSFAVHLIENGADVHVIQEILGHADLSSTEMYANMIRNSISSVYSKAHPRASFSE